MNITRKLFGGMLVLSVIALAGLQVSIIKARLHYQPILFETLAPVPDDQGKESALDLNQGVKLQQRFKAPTGTLSHIGVGVSNFRQALESDVIMVELRHEESGHTISAAVPVAALRSGDISLWPVTASLEPDAAYVLTVSAPNTPSEKSLTVHYEPSGEVQQSESLVLENSADRKRERPGNIHVALYQYPLRHVVTSALITSPISYIILGYGVVILFLFLPPIRRYVAAVFKEPYPLAYDKPIRKREMSIVWVVALAVAFGITLPFYTHLDHLDTQGDVQRMLIYRALGRDALLEEGSVARWDPYTCGGVPLIGNIESVHLDPLFIFTILFGENSGLRLATTATLIFGLTGTYALARRYLHASSLAAWLAASIFVLTGFQMLALTTGVLSWLPVGLVPWFLYFLLRAHTHSAHAITASILLSAIFLGGNPHMPVFAALTALIVVAVLAWQQRTLKPVALLLLIGVLTANLSAIKLLPAVELMSLLTESFERPPEFVAPLSWLPQMFWDRTPELTERWTNPATPYRWPEYGSYMGIVPIVLVLIGLPLSIKKRYVQPWLAVAAIFLLMTFGLFPWTALREIPVLSEIIRSASRFRSMFFLGYGLVAAASLTLVARRIPHQKIRQLFTVVLVGFVFVDLVTLHMPLFKNLYDLPKPPFTRSENFKRVLHSYTNEPSGYYRAAYINYLSNEGVTDLCVPNLEINREVASTGQNTSNPAEPYRGEVYLLASKQPAELTYLSSTRLSATLKPITDDWLVFNQNYFPGWQSEPPREVTRKNGLLAIRVNKNDTAIDLTYRTPAYRIGFFVSLISFFLLLMWTLFYSRDMRRKEKPLLRSGV